MTREAQTDAGSRRMRTVTCTASISAATHCRLDAFLRQQTVLWNAALEERIDCHRKIGKTITAFGQMKSLTEIRRDDEGFSRFHLHAQRSVLCRLDKAFRSFFDRVKRGEKPGFPRFKGRNRGIHSFDIPDPVIRDGSLWVKGIGRFRLPSIPATDIVQARVIKSALRVSVQFVVEQEARPAAQPSEPVGIDMGLRNRAIMSHGETVAAVTIDQRPLKRAQRAVSRAKKGSASRRRKVKAVRPRVGADKDAGAQRAPRDFGRHRETPQPDRRRGPPGLEHDAASDAGAVDRRTAMGTARAATDLQG